MIRFAKLMLKPPYSIAAMAALIKVFGVAAMTPPQTDIPPNINAPAFGAAFSYAPSPTDGLSARAVSFGAPDSGQGAGPIPLSDEESSS